MARFFIDRPVFAIVLALVMLIGGAVAGLGLPIAQFPQITLPTIRVATAYPGANADAVEKAVGIRPELPPHMAGLFDRPERVTRVENDVEALKSLILERRTA